MKKRPHLIPAAILALACLAHGGTIGELGILQGSANGGINPATGTTWAAGDTYHLAFVTSGTRNATSADIADYHAFVQAAANAAGMGGVTWYCIGQSYDDPTRNTNAPPMTSSLGIFLVDGITKLADNGSDLANGPDVYFNMTESGGTYNGAMATGSSRKFGDPTQSKIEHGNSERTNAQWWQVYNGSQSSQWHFYAISEALTAVADGPETDPPVIVTTDPADNSTGFPINNPLVATFDETIAKGSGNITITNLGGPDTIIDVSDTDQVSVDGKILTIDPTALLLPSTDYAVRIDNGAVTDFFTNPFPGISDDTTWNFATGGDSLLTALEELADHIDGTISLTGSQIAAHKAAIDTEKGRLDDTTTNISAAFDLVTTYDTIVGALWLPGSPVQGFSRDSVSDEDIDWVIFNVMQYIIDEIYNAATLADPAKRALLDGFLFASVEEFPGAVSPPASATTHTATISASFPDTFGRDTQQWTLPARKPTGTYLAPGSIVTVTVPPALVGQGYQVRVGAHSWDHEAKNRKPVQRLSRATIAYDLDATSIEVASPYGGGIYIEVPMGSADGVVSVDITGAVRSPYFSAKPFHTTTNAEWIATERIHPAPWADFQTEKFMMQVPTTWIFALNDPAQLMSDWDDAMDAMNDLMGFPHIRGKETMYLQPDVILRSSVHAPGYPAVNVKYTYNPSTTYSGYQNNHLVRGPSAGWSTEFHEQGHAYFFPKFGGETEADVNLLYVPILNRKFGVSLDDAFRRSIGFPNGSITNPLDKTAVLWMTSFNFAPREAPMGSWEKSYQPQGHAKFVDVARLFGWDGLGDYWYSYMLEEENGTLPSSPTSTDNLLIRLCRNIGEDIRPLFHFWGIHPEDPVALETAVLAEGLTPSPEIYNLLKHYRSLVPADNAAYQAFCHDWYNKDLVAPMGGYGVEREHKRQWDNTSYWEANEWSYGGTAATNPDGTPIVDDGEIYLAASATRITTVLDNLIDLYFTDYTVWAALYPGTDLDDPDADSDGDRLTNTEERVWGLDPTSASTMKPFTLPLDLDDRGFDYTRRDDSLTGLTYSVHYSTDMENWHEDAGAVQDTPADPDSNGIETVSVTLSPALLAETTLFVRLQATE